MKSVTEEKDGEIKYQDCGDFNKIIALKHFDSYPKTLTIPQNLTLSVVFEIFEDLTRYLKVGYKSVIGFGETSIFFKDKYFNFKETSDCGLC